MLGSFRLRAILHIGTMRSHSAALRAGTITLIVTAAKMARLTAAMATKAVAVTVAVKTVAAWATLKMTVTSTAAVKDLINLSLEKV